MILNSSIINSIDNVKLEFNHILSKNYKWQLCIEKMNKRLWDVLMVSVEIAKFQFSPKNVINMMNMCSTEFIV